MKTLTHFFAVMLVGGLPAVAGLAAEEKSFECPGLVAEAMVSGVESGGTYGEVPPVLVELTGLKQGSELWVEVRHESQGAGEGRVIRPKSEEILWRDDIVILNVPGLDKICRKDGQWTLQINLRNGLGRVTPARVSFEVDSSKEPEVGGLAAFP